MPTKYETFAELAVRTERMLTDSTESWKSFLVAAARLYKYPYHEQLLIFAQRPDRLHGLRDVEQAHGAVCQAWFERNCLN